MIIVVLIVGVILFSTIFFVGDLIVNTKKSIRRKRQKEFHKNRIFVSEFNFTYYFNKRIFSVGRD